MIRPRRRFSRFVLAVSLLIAPALVLADRPAPTEAASSPVKLVFIHHSCGEAWLADENGGLGEALARRGYFVSDTNYGWGPESIGDRTDILDWPTWFCRAGSAAIMRSLLAESERHGEYRRTAKDPGGPNRIVLFKSCFPNSCLGGSPNDPPRPGGTLTVGSAKAVYEELLTAFARHPSILFVAITAPPVQDASHGTNARAFNTWLVEEWLRDYRGSNVAVFDFYNVLTHPGAHHRMRGNRIEHVHRPGRNTLAYAVDPEDDHPSAVGNRKATREFLPLLDHHVARWRKAGGLALPPPVPTTPAEQAVPPGADEPDEPIAMDVSEGENVSSRPDGIPPVLPDDFEGPLERWSVFRDMAKAHMTIGRDPKVRRGGQASLRIDFDVRNGGWATCSLVLPRPADWKESVGIAFHVKSEGGVEHFRFVAYQGESPDELAHFEAPIAIGAEGTGGWRRVEFRFDRLEQPSWQGDPSARFDPGRAMGLAFAFDGEGGATRGRLWIDDLTFIRGIRSGAR